MVVDRYHCVGGGLVTESRRPSCPWLTTAVGWRVFAVDDDGALIPPFVRRYWTEREQPRDVWQPGVNVARCLDADHDAPDEDCTCGFRATLVLKELLTAVARPFAGTSSVS